MNYKKIKNIGSKAITSIIFLATLFTVGATAAAGIALINPHLALTISAFLLSSVVEGQVYQRNIYAAFLNFFSWQHKTMMHRARITELLEYCLENDTLKEQLKNNKFFQSYCELQVRLIKLKETLKNATNKDNAKKIRQKIADAERHSDYLIDALLDRIINAADQTSSNEKETTLIETSADGFLEILATHDKDAYSIGKLQHELRAANRQHRTVVGITIAAIAGQFFGSVFMAQSALVHFGIASSLASSIVIGPAALAAIGYGLLMYHSMAAMIKDKTLIKTWRNIRESLKENKGWDRAKIIAKYSLPVLIFTFATVVTAGTWWFAGRAGINMLYKHFPRYTDIIVTSVTSAFAAIAESSFNFDNILEALETIKKLSPRKIWSNLWATLKKQQGKETNYQFFNPFRFLRILIAEPSRIGIFIGHVGSIGYSSDHFCGIPPIYAGAGNVLMEVASDADYVIPEDLTHTGSAPPPKVDQEQSSADYLVTLMAEENEEKNKVDLIKLAADIIVFPIDLLAMTWDFAAQILKPNKEQRDMSRRKRFYQSAKKYFPKITGLFITDTDDNQKKNGNREILENELKQRRSQQQDNFFEDKQLSFQDIITQLRSASQKSSLSEIEKRNTSALLNTLTGPSSSLSSSSPEGSPENNNPKPKQTELKPGKSPQQTIASFVRSTFWKESDTSQDKGKRKQHRSLPEPIQAILADNPDTNLLTIEPVPNILSASTA